MTDRKTIMSWLEGLAEPNWRMFHSDSEVQNIAKETLNLLKEQQPVEIEREGDNRCWWFVCEECHGMVDDNDSYCRHCGRPFRKKVQRDG